MQYIFMRFPQGKSKALTFSYDDGVLSDKKLRAIFDEHNLKCTFNINSGQFITEEEKAKSTDPTRRMTIPEALETYNNSNHELAIHGINHSFMEQLPLSTAVYEGLNDRLNLEKTFGRVVRGMAYPFGTWNDALVEGLKLSGVAYSRTTYATHSFDVPEEWLKLNPTCHHNDEQLFDLAEKFVNEFPAETWRNGKPWLFYVWGHSYEFVRQDNWDRIEKLADMVSNKDDIWYATNIEIYDYVQAYRNLAFSVDASMVTNNSAFEIWFEQDGQTKSVKPGETKKLF